MPDDVACGVIAHELGHVSLWATGRGEEFGRQTRPDYHTNATAYKNDPEENEVRRIVTEWGFDETLYESWCKQRDRQERKTMTQKRKAK